MMGIVENMRATIDGREYEAEVEIFSSEPQIEDGYVIDIIKTNPPTPVELKKKVYEIFHSLVLKISRKDG